MAECMTLNKSNCNSCYKCLRVCPVKSIRFVNGQAQIIKNECVLCGRCVSACPQGAKQPVADVDKVKKFMADGYKVVVCLDPGFVANYKGIGINGMREGLKKLGVYEVEETSVAATYIRREYERVLREEKPDVLLSSSCHSVNLLIQKHFPDLLPYLAKVVLPMYAQCKEIRDRYPDCKIVYAGPCLAEKTDTQFQVDAADTVLTFEELSLWMKQEGVELQPVPENTEEGRARLFPVTGGIIHTMDQTDSDYMYLSVDGVSACIEVLKDLRAGKVHNCFIEMRSCRGACIGSPAMEGDRHLILNKMYVKDYAGSKDFDVPQPEKETLQKEFKEIKQRLHKPTDAEIRMALRKLGKTTPDTLLNCGTCGYDSCREKAIAICQGKTDASMCMPYLKENAASFSNNIVAHSPIGIVVLDEDLLITQINPAACRIFKIASPSYVIGELITVIMDPDPFLEALDEQKTVDAGRIYLKENNVFVKVTVVFEESDNKMFAIIEDVSQEERERRDKELIFQQTVVVADEVVDKQMRIVQEIASLLGETTAETKIVLTKLKESIRNE